MNAQTLIQILQLVLALSILVGLHELGHMLAAKAFGMRVEKFSIGFPPKIVSFKKGETQYQIGAIPLGGFVKISGMIDESLDTKNMKEEPEPWEFRAKPAWQRLIVMMGGIIVNVILGIVVFSVFTMIRGEQYIPASEVNEKGIVALEHGQKMGLKTGDKIVNINGKPFERFSELMNLDVLLLKDSSYYTVERNDSIFKVYIPENFLTSLENQNEIGKFISYHMPFKVGEVMQGTPARASGLQKGDKIVQIDSMEVIGFYDLKTALQKNAGDSIQLKVERNGETIALSSNVTENGTLGFYPESLVDREIIRYGFIESIGIGTSKAFNTVFEQVRILFSGKLSRENLVGPIGMFKIFKPNWNWGIFWAIVGTLSMWLAFVNFLPIPALDGGHVMFLTYEIISGRKPGDKFLETAQKVGMVLLLTLMAFVIFNDVINLIP